MVGDLKIGYPSVPVLSTKKCPTFNKPIVFSLLHFSFLVHVLSKELVKVQFRGQSQGSRRGQRTGSGGRVGGLRAVPQRALGPVRPVATSAMTDTTLWSSRD